MAGGNITILSDEEEDEIIEDEEEEPLDGVDLQRGRAAAPDDDDDDDDDEEDEEGQDEYEKDDFIVDEVDDEEPDDDGGDEERQKKKRKKKRESEKNYVLDEDDYELLEDNGFRRPKDGKMFKRLKKAQRDAGEHSGRFSDENGFDGSGESGRTAGEEIEHSLFGDERGPLLEDIAEEDDQPDEEDVDDDEMADFIVEEEDIDEHGAPMRARKNSKKKSRPAAGVSMVALQEAHDIFGDVDELLERRKKVYHASAWKENRLEDEFEPIVLSEKFMTPKDDRIREIDVPERIQINEESTGPPPTDDISIIENESNWIYNQLINGMVPLISNNGIGQTEEERAPTIIKEITRFLELSHVQKLDVPFIAMYRKEECPNLLKKSNCQNELGDENQDKSDKMLKWHKVLWAIQDLDRKWLLLQKRKSALQLYYNKRYREECRRIDDETRLSLNQQLFESIVKSLKAAESEKEVDDVDSKFNLHFPLGDVGADEGQYKRPKKQSFYSSCNKYGLWMFASKFGYSSEQFGLQISLQNMGLDELEDAKDAPEVTASEFICALFKSPADVLKGARHMAAVEISCEPSVRKHIRSIFMDNAMVSTTPTQDGNIAIDTFHQYAGVKWLRDKPLTRFDDAQWLLIEKAEEEKLLQVSIKLPEHIQTKLISDSNDYYLSDGVSKFAQLWNEQRKLILQDAFFTFLIPSMEKEARSMLASRAKNWLRMEYGKVLWEKVSVAPYQRKENDVTSEEEAAPRVMACCWGPGKPATTFVMLDSSGEVLDVLYTGSLTSRSQNVDDQQRKKNDQQRVLKFMTDHQPHVVVLGAVNLSCTRLKDDIYEIIFKMVEENPRDVCQEMDGLSIVYGDESLPHIYENSRISSDQLPGQSAIVKRSVALGRYLQNPLAMVATLCGPGREVLSWKLSPLDKFLTDDEKYMMVEQVMVDVTNQVGLDINLAASHEWLFAPLQFVAGLGPRKAASLQRSLVRSGSIFTRKDFVTVHGLGKKVFVNAVGFLRVRRSGLAASSSQYIDLLDDTRIHPESYGLAQEVAKEVYKEDVQDDGNDDDDVLEMAIEHVRDRPQIVNSFDAYQFAKDTNRENKMETFNDIKMELIHGFRDWRKQFQELSPDEEFLMISGETEESLAEGRIVQATVRRVQANRAFCMLESGLTGMLNKEDYSDDSRDINELSERLNEGDILTCKIKSILKNRYQVFLTCRESEMRSNKYDSVRNHDMYYHEDRSNSLNEKEKARSRKELDKKHFKPRMIVHPCFQNITADEAIEFLADKDPGESIVRPSSRGPSYLTLTLKVYDGVYAHKDIVEGGKEHKDITSLLRIGKSLRIGEDTFEDLDEVMDRYVDPLVTHLKTMVNYRKFRKGSKAEVDEMLRVEKSEFPMRIVYCFGISHEHPGTFILTYIRSSNPHHEYVGLYPKGFKFRKRMFEDIDRLVAYFQRHIDEPQHDSTPSLRSVAAMVPMRSPANGGSGNSWDGNNEGSGGGRRGGSGGRSYDRDRSSRGGRNSGGGRDDHPSGAPRPYGGRGRGGRGNRNEDGGEDGAGGGGWGSFPGAKVQNSPGREAFPGGWGTGGSGTASGDGGGWGGASTSSTGDAGGWGAAATKSSPPKAAAGGGWGGGGGW